MSVVARRVVVHGRVQGVFFRDSVRRLAREHGVTGWARNNADGSVEALLEGPGEAVERVIAFCHEGPPDARVESLEVCEQEPAGMSEFTVR